MKDKINLLSEINKIKKIDLNCNVFSVYDYNGYSLQELLCVFYSKINECVDLSNLTIELAKWLVNEGLAIEVALKLEEWLTDGTLADLINITIFEDLNNDIKLNTDEIEKLKIMIENIFNGDVENVHNQKPYNLRRKPYGTFDTASVMTVNNTGAQAEVMGIRNHNELATYRDRDFTSAYIQANLQACTKVKPLEYTTNSVTVDGDISELKVGMILDCINESDLEPFSYQNRTSGVITEIDGNKLIVSGWYKQGNTSEGQKPTEDTVILNPMTKAWCINANIMIDEDAYGVGGMVAEFGMFNGKNDPSGNTAGVDVVAFKGSSDYGYQARVTKKDIASIFHGYRSIGANVGFYCENNDSVGFFANNSQGSAFKTYNNMFDITYNGLIRALGVTSKIHSTHNSVLEPRDAHLHVITGTGTHIQLPENVGAYASQYFKVLALGTDNRLWIKTGGIAGQSGFIELERYKYYDVWCDGSTWYIG